MKQTFRFLLRPTTFFNQLQWSRNHWLIILSFLTLATIETQIGRHNSLYFSAATYLKHSFGIGFDLALWLIMAAKLCFLLVGAFAVSTIIYFVGTIVGQPSSRRVLFRRMAVVFTVFLGAYTLQHFVDREPVLNLVAMVLYAWGFILGFVAIKEQFELNKVQALLVGVLAAVMVTTTWKLSNHLFETTVRAQMKSLAARPTMPTVQFRNGTDL